MTDVRCGVDVVAGILPGTPIDELTRQWFITSEEWNAEGVDHAQLLSDLAGKASAWLLLLFYTLVTLAAGFLLGRWL